MNPESVPLNVRLTFRDRLAAIQLTRHDKLTK